MSELNRNYQVLRLEPEGWRSILSGYPTIQRAQAAVRHDATGDGPIEYRVGAADGTGETWQATYRRNQRMMWKRVQP